MSVFDSVVKGVQGLAARGAAASGNPLQAGGTYRSSPAAVDDGDAVDLLMDSAGRAVVNVNSLPASTNTIEVVGDVAHDSAAGGNPLLVGGIAGNAFQAAVANADAVRLLADLAGRLVVAPHTMLEKEQHYASSADITDTNDDEVFAAVASTKHCITQITASCSHASTGTYVVLKDNDTVIFVGYAAPAGGGFAVSFPVPLVCSSGVHVNVANITNSSATRVSVSGFQIPG